MYMSVLAGAVPASPAGHKSGDEDCARTGFNKQQVSYWHYKNISLVLYLILLIWSLSLATDSRYRSIVFFLESSCRP
jgi:hypothetical protein